MNNKLILNMSNREYCYNNIVESEWNSATDITVLNVMNIKLKENIKSKKYCMNSVRKPTIKRKLLEFIGSTIIMLFNQVIWISVNWPLVKSFYL